ncbi:MAG: hypothetical protein AAGL17_18090 [Cyanobacteria bacterium J06576_12]
MKKILSRATSRDNTKLLEIDNLYNKFKDLEKSLADMSDAPKERLRQRMLTGVATHSAKTAANTRKQAPARKSECKRPKRKASPMTGAVAV